MAVVVAGLAASCASSGSGGWTKPGMTEQELGRDTAHCLSRAQELRPDRDGPRMVVDQDRYQACMAALGYSRGQ